MHTSPLYWKFIPVDKQFTFSRYAGVIRSQSQTESEDLKNECLPSQARNRGGGCTGCIRTPPQAPKVHILILNVQAKEYSWSN